jgi:hypothetical protein
MGGVNANSDSIERHVYVGFVNPACPAHWQDGAYRRIDNDDDGRDGIGNFATCTPRHGGRDNGNCGRECLDGRGSFSVGDKCERDAFNQPACRVFRWARLLLWRLV